MSDVTFHIDASRLPVLVARWPSTWASMIACESALQEMAACRRHGRIAWVVDVRASSKPSMQERGLIAAFLRQLREGDSDVGGFAVVSTSKTARGVMLALNWLARRPYPIEPFADIDSAIAWAAGAAAPPPPRR